MDLTFHCPHCKQEMAVDISAAGSVIQCPTCNSEMTVPEGDVSSLHGLNPIATSAAAKEERHFSVPVHEAPAEVLIEKKEVLEEVSRDGDKKLRLRIFRHTDCIEVGKDRYEEIVAGFLNRVGESNIVSITPLTYTHIDIASQKVLTDYAMQILYRG